MQVKQQGSRAKCLQRDRYPYSDGKEELVFETWREDPSGSLYFQAFRQNIPEKEGDRVKRKQCSIPFHILVHAVSIHGGEV